MSLDLPSILAQTALLLLLAPLLSGLIKNWKAKLQNRRGPRLWQPYLDVLKFVRKDMVISEHASWIFSVTPYALFLTAVAAGLMVPMVTARAPMSLFGGALAVAYAAMFIVLRAVTGLIPVDNPTTHLELTMIHEAMLLEYSDRYLALLEWGASVKQLVLMALLANIFFPVGLAVDTTLAAVGLGLVYFVAKLIVLAGAVVLVETTNAKLRLFRVPDLLSTAFILATLALVSTFLFR